VHVYEVRPRKDKRGVDLVSDALPFGRLWYEDASAAVDYAKHQGTACPNCRVSARGNARQRVSRAGLYGVWRGQGLGGSFGVGVALGAGRSIDVALVMSFPTPLLQPRN